MSHKRKRNSLESGPETFHENLGKDVRMGSSGIWRIGSWGQENKHHPERGWEPQKRPLGAAVRSWLGQGLHSVETPH